MKEDISFGHDKRERKFAKWSILFLTCVLTVFCFITPSTIFGQDCSLTLSPLSKTLAVGETHQLEATFICRGMPQTGIQIDFQIIGPNSASSGSAITDGAGMAQFSYEGKQEGEDTITAEYFSFQDIATAAWTQESEPPIVIETGPAKLNVNSQGVLPMIVYGSEDFDVQTIDPSSLRLNGAVSPQHYAYEDAGSKSSGEPDDFLDLCLKFDTQEIVQALEAQGVPLSDGQLVTLILTGSLYNTETAIQTARAPMTISAEQTVEITNKGKEKKGK